MCSTEDVRARTLDAYFVEDGVFENTTIGDIGFSGPRKDVRLVEVDIAADFTSTPVPNAEVWCLDTHAF